MRLREGSRTHTVHITDGRPRYDVVAPDSALGQALIGAHVGEQRTVVLGSGIPNRTVVVLDVA